MIAVLLLLLSALAAPPAEVHADREAFADALLTQHRALHEAASWASPTRPERMAVVAGMTTLARTIDHCRAHALDRAAAELEPARHRLTLHQVQTERYVVVLDASGHGAGWWVWRCGEATEVLLQAPHGFHDLDTDDLVLAGFVRGHVRGAGFNSVHRYRADPEEQPADEVHPADVTRQPASVFHTVSLAWTVSRPALRLVQLHGFADREGAPDIIVSTGLEHRPPTAAAEALATHTGRAVGAFGDDVSLLGGTVNALSPLLGPAGRFLHVELTRDVRRQLRDDPEATVAFVDTLTGVPW